MSKYQFRIQDQVIVRRPISNGNGTSLIKLGTILAFKDGGVKAEVSFPGDQTRTIINIDQLEPVSARFGRARVNIDPVRRTVGFLR